MRRTKDILCKCGMASTVNQSKSARFAPRIFRHSNRFLALVNVAFKGHFDDNNQAVISEEGLASDEGFFCLTFCEWSLLMSAENPSDSKKIDAAEYNESDIQVLDDVEHVRRRPGMYIGGYNPRGLHHLVYEIVDNSI